MVPMAPTEDPSMAVLLWWVGLALGGGVVGGLVAALVETALCSLGSYIRRRIEHVPERK
jgi:hypothetical protein